MSDSHAGDSGTFIKTPTQLVVVVVLAFVVPIAMIFTIIHFVMGGHASHSAAGTSDAVIADRIKPVGSVPASAISKEPSPLLAAPAPIAAAPATAPGGAPAAPGAAAAGPDGKAVFEATCKTCHEAGVAGAPKTGDKAAWGPRMGQGIAGLVASATKGKGAMPPKGGNPGLSEADLKAAIEYMTK